MKAGDRIKLSKNIKPSGVLAGAHGEIKEVKSGEVRVLLDATSTTRWTGREFWVDFEIVEASGKGSA